VLARDVLLDVLRSEGVRHIFGNPGSTELPLIDALAGANDLDYVLALQEASAVAMADGYAQITGRPAFLNLHTSAGLGNAIGNLTNAGVVGTPLVVTAGQQDERHIAADPMLSGDLVGLARPVSKWAHELRTADELAVYVRRAFHDAASPPAGPVFLALPMNLLEEEFRGPLPSRTSIERGIVPAALPELAHLLAEVPVGELAIVVGDEVSAAGGGGVEDVVALADALGAPVFGSPLHSTGLFVGRHPLWAGQLPLSAAQVNSTLQPFRRVLLLGGQPFMAYPYTPAEALPAGTELLHVSPDPRWLGRYYAARLALIGDPAATAAALVPLLADRVDGTAVAKARAEATARRGDDEAALEAKALARYGPTPVHPMAAVHAALRAMPADAIVVDEAITNGGYVHGFHHGLAPGRYLRCRGGGLGWGMPAAVGAALADPGRPVICVVGDGAALYSVQSLWTAARLRMPVVFVVVNNRQYLILKRNLEGMRATSVAEQRFVAMDLDDPPVDYVELAAGFGVDGTLVKHADDITDAVRSAVERGGPHLVEVPITG
jgi:benzoylformate decarboxylase